MRTWRIQRMRTKRMTTIIPEEVKARILDRIGVMVKNEAIRNCPTDLGQLRQSIDYKVEGNTVTIFSELSYAAYMEYGTGIFHIDENGNPDPHGEWDIVPVNAQALRFEVGRKARLVAKRGPKTANIVFAKKVHMVGVHPRAFLRPAAFNNIPQMKEIARQEIER
jgi:hypothetical protein